MATISPQDPTPVPAVSFKKRTNKSTQRKRPTTPPADDSASSLSSSEDESGHRIKRRKTAGVAVGSSAPQQQNKQNHLDSVEQDEAGSSKVTSYAADRTVALNGSNDATKHSDWYEEKQAQGRNGATSSKNGGNGKDSVARPSKEKTAPDGSSGTYKGVAGYQQSFNAKNPDAADKGKRSFGPTKAPASNVRTVTTMDFAPDVCKDYKKTGFCGFGDSCKYLHTREVYKQGWELDKDWDSTSKKDKAGKTVASADRSKTAEEQEEDADNEMLEKIPFACVICEGPYKFPVQTRCGHYFCEGCALGRYKKVPGCAVCGVGTGGVFNGAKQLKRLLERKRERVEKRREEEGDDGNG